MIQMTRENLWMSLSEVSACKEIRELKQQRQRQLRKRHLKKAVPLLQISSRLSLSSADVGNFFCS